MSYKDSHFQVLKVPLTWTVGVALIVGVVIAIALLLSDRRETLQEQAYSTARAVVDAVDMPVNQVIAAPGRWTAQGLEFVGDYFAAGAQNRRLRAEVRDLRRWRDAAVALRDVNERYRALLGFRTDPPIPMVSARVILDARGPFSNTRLADAGRERKVMVGNPVMSEQGLVGRVIGVTRGASRILLLTDVASRTPVLIDRTDARAILAGDAGPAPRLDYARGPDAVREGDRVLTSGDGGMFPRGLPVGTVVRGLDGSWRVRLDADEASIDFVRILLFEDFSAFVDMDELNATQVAPLEPSPRGPPRPAGAPASVTVPPARPRPAPAPPQQPVQPAAPAEASPPPAEAPTP